MTGLALVSALWCRYCFGETDSGKPISRNDDNWDRLQAQSRRARENPKAWLEMGDIFGELGQNADYVAAFSAGLTSLWAEGTPATLTRYLEGRL